MQFSQSSGLRGVWNPPVKRMADDRVIENWYRNRGLLSGNKTTRWITSPNSFSERLEIIDADKSAEVIQKIWRGFLDRRYVEDLRAVAAAGLRVYWNEDGEMVVINLEEAATKIQRVYRGWSVRAKDEHREKRYSLCSNQVAHGTSRGGKKNPLGSFCVSKKKDTVLAAGFCFQKGGDQRWAVGMKSKEYCPTHIKIDIGAQFMCLCQCPSTMKVRTTVMMKELEREDSEMIFT